MTESVYHISEDFIKRKKSVFMMLRIIIPIFLIFMSGLQILQVIDKDALVSNISGIIISIIVLEIIMFFVPNSIFKRYRKTEVVLKSQCLEKRFGNYCESIYLTPETTMKKKQNKQGDILQLKIRNKNKTMELFGVQNMNELVERITLEIGNQSKISTDTSIINEKTASGRLKSIFLGLALYILILAVSIILIIIGMKYFNRDISNVIDSIIPIGFGLVLVILSPISKSLGYKFKNYEVFGGLVIIILCVMKMIFK